MMKLRGSCVPSICTYKKGSCLIAISIQERASVEMPIYVVQRR
jgi:hypothetical protein